MHVMLHSQRVKLVLLSFWDILGSLKYFEIMKHVETHRDSPVGCPRLSPGCELRLVLMGETPENVLEQWIHLNLVRRTHKLDENQKIILSRLMLHPSRYRAIWFQCGSFRLKQLSLREVCLRYYYFSH